MEENTVFTHELLFELIPLYFEKLGIIFKRADHLNLNCNKNQNRAIHMIKRQGKITATHLGKQLDMEKGSLTSLIDGLQEKNLVLREPHATDRRKTLLVLTPQGEQYFANMAASYRKHLTEILAEQPADEIERFNHSLKEVVDFLKKL